MSSSLIKPDDAPSNTVRSCSPVPSSAMFTPATDPSSAFLTNTRSMIRMMPRSTRSTSIGRPSPVILFPGELDDQIVDRAHLFEVVAHWFLSPFGLRASPWWRGARTLRGYHLRPHPGRAIEGRGLHMSSMHSDVSLDETASENIR